MTVAKNVPYCATRRLKKVSAFALRHEVYGAEALFKGVIHFTNIDFAGQTVFGTDYMTVLKYASLASGPIQSYCNQYGSCSLAIDAQTYSWTAPSSSFDDATLQTWIEQIATQFNFPTTDCVAILCPTGATNTDAPLSGGVLGYHGSTGKHTYIFMNLEGTGLTIADEADIYSAQTSHEIEEMVVDPAADLGNPEVSDPCAGNCAVDYRDDFDLQGNFLGQHPQPNYAFSINGVVQIGSAQACPAPLNACVYPPSGTPSPTPTPTPTPTNPCVTTIEQGVTDIEQGVLAGDFGQVEKGAVELIDGIVCLLDQGLIRRSALRQYVRKLKSV